MPIQGISLEVCRNGVRILPDRLYGLFELRRRAACGQRGDAKLFERIPPRMEQHGKTPQTDSEINYFTSLKCGFQVTFRDSFAPAALRVTGRN